MVVMFGTTGTKSQKVPITSDGRTQLEIGLLIPSPDTCEVKFRILSSGHPKCSRFMTYTFTAVQDTVVLYAVPPANLPRSKIAPRTAPARSPLSHVIPGEFPEDDSLYGIPEPPEDVSKNPNLIAAP